LSDRFITLLRHGEVVGGPRFRGPLDDPLTPRGRGQLDAAFAQLGGWDRLVASPSRRCRGPATALAERLAIPLVIDQDLAERGFGSWNGRRAAEIPETHLARFYADPGTFNPVGAEPMDEFALRVRRSWLRLLAGANPSTLLLTHGGVIRLIVSEVLQLPTASLGLIEVPYACITRIRVPEAPGRPSLIFHGDLARCGPPSSQQ
jgi:broad specificity phosphatase PhoE